MIVPFPPGGPNDILGRVIGAELSRQFNQQVVIDNRGGAGGTIGTDLAAKAAPDGYTLLLGGTASMAINPGLMAKLPYDAVNDFALITLLATAPSLLVVHPSLPVKTVRDLIVLAKAKPGTLNYASAGIGTPPHLAGELFKAMAGVSLVHVPYKGGGPALTDLLAGQVELYFSGISSALQLARDGKVRPIAVTSLKRTAVAPELPTIAEAGVPGYEVGNWYAVVAPARTPAPVIARLNGELVKATRNAEIKRRFLELGADPVGSTPEELAKYQRAEIEKWAKVIKSAGIKPE
jgi:tripartite-type tricarboxylate transporter receptor subunit TctC